MYILPLITSAKIPVPGSAGETAGDANLRLISAANDVKIAVLEPVPLTDTPLIKYV